jgi:cytochrome c-type biogenesis protein CcmH
MLLFGLLSAQSAWSGEAQPLTDDPALEQRMLKLAEQLRCLVCQNETLASSRADLAKDLRRDLREQLKAGKSDKEIIAFLTDRYGDFVLYKPPMKPVTWLLWFGPFLLLLGGAAGLFAYLKKRARRAETSFSPEERAKMETLLNIKKDQS